MWPWAGKMPGLLFRTQISFLEEQCGSSSVHFPGQVKFLNAPTEFEHLKCSRGSHWLWVFVCTSWGRQSILFLLSPVQLFVTPWTAARQASLSITNSQSLLKLMSIEFVTPSNHLILCRPLLLLPSIFPNIRVFSNESALRIRWPKYWSFSCQWIGRNQSFQWIFRVDFL